VLNDVVETFTEVASSVTTRLMAVMALPVAAMSITSIVLHYTCPTLRLCIGPVHEVANLEQGC